MRRVVFYLILLALIASACDSVRTATPVRELASQTPPAVLTPTETRAFETPPPATTIPSSPTPSEPTSASALTMEATAPEPTTTTFTPFSIPNGPLLIDGLRTIQLIGNPQSGDSFYALTPTGLYITRNGGLTWIQVTPAPMQDQFVFSPDEPSILYAGAGRDCYRGGPDQPFYKSVNGGATWTELPNGINLRPAVAHPTDPNRIWAIECTGLAFSSDGGSTWSTISDDLFLTYDPNHVALSDDWLVIYVSGVSEGGSGIIASSQDGGDTWVPLLRETPERLFWWINDLIVLSTTPHQIFTIDPHGFWRSLDGGSSWDFFDDGLEQVIYQNGFDFATTGLNALAVDNSTTPQTIYLGTAQGVFQSLDAGGTWSKLFGTAWENAPIRDLALSQVTPQAGSATPSPRLFITTEEGIFVYNP